MNDIKINNFVELAERFLPKKQVEKFKIEKERQDRSSTYFTHMKMYDSYMRRLKSKEEAQKKRAEVAIAN